MAVNGDWRFMFVFMCVFSAVFSRVLSSFFTASRHFSLSTVFQVVPELRPYSTKIILIMQRKYIESMRLYESAFLARLVALSRGSGSSSVDVDASFATGNNVNGECGLDGLG